MNRLLQNITYLPSAAISVKRICLGLAIFLITSCGAIDTMKEGMDHSKAVSSQLEKSLGVKSNTGFQWINGTLRTVTVEFSQIPPNTTLAEIGSITKKTVIDEFKQTPDSVVIAFEVDTIK